MVGSLSVASAFQPSQLLGVLGGTGSTADTDATGGQSSATVSGPGQLLSDLQQLQAQNPTQFQQVTSNIASQLQAAAQQQGTSAQGSFLSNLAQKFQNVANGGNLSQLQPSQHQHHHHHAQQAYGQGAQGASQGVSGLAPAGTTQSTSDPLQQLFASITQEVQQALSA